MRQDCCMSDDGYYEDDEAAEAVLAAYERGNKGVTEPPATAAPSGQIEPSETYRAFLPGPSRRSASNTMESGHLVQA